VAVEEVEERVQLQALGILVLETCVLRVIALELSS